MSYEHNEEWRMGVVLALAWQEVQPVEKVSGEGERFVSFVHHLDGEGLIQISQRSADSEEQIVYRLDRRGGLIGVFTCSAREGDQLLYDRDSGFGKRHESEVKCSTMLGRLASLLLAGEIGDLAP